ncbi:sedoheptulose-1,7-bisphosphatase [Grosmannia clavigera kw1407]|uniref:Sedoheptulose-1,7-bisphosphatase n=1 Tax=Grosmannia clavigera (strain kw1407 / UAMH 11150) TaxID=655863 RepID=F0XBE8_GROCL|nr:sedoheptulose-1,7-bisphosphatase [Grosmannia clavigera kw1407]EFX05082.1 sedoheptulose-1,7-bisphosphatase [Grosmannia clavigera kw1407]
MGKLGTSVLPALLDCIADIAKALRKSSRITLAGTSNVFGDGQLNVDIAAEDLVRTALARCPSVVTASSEEDPIEKPTGVAVDANASEQYTVAFDPLDGSSIIAPNWTVGTIIGIWDGASALRQRPADKQIAAILGVYGPRTTAIVALRVPGAEPVCFEVGLEDGISGGYETVRECVRYADAPFKTRYFAPANLRAAADNDAYQRLITQYIQNRYTLRYSGGLVPDIVHALVKGHGVYISPVTATSAAKLRRLYELCPVALVVECAGGRALDPLDGEPILSRPSVSCDERAGLKKDGYEDIPLRSPLPYVDGRTSPEANAAEADPEAAVRAISHAIRTAATASATASATVVATDEYADGVRCYSEEDKAAAKAMGDVLVSMITITGKLCLGRKDAAKVTEVWRRLFYDIGTPMATRLAAGEQAIAIKTLYWAELGTKYEPYRKDLSTKQKRAIPAEKEAEMMREFYEVIAAVPAASAPAVMAAMNKSLATVAQALATTVQVGRSSVATAYTIYARKVAGDGLDTL